PCMRLPVIKDSDVAITTIAVIAACRVALPACGRRQGGFMKTIPASRPLLWLVLALPGLWILYRWGATPEAYGYGHAIGDSGDWAAWLLLLTLAVTALRLLFRGRKWTNWLLRRRRDLGVASFAYAAGHTAIYLADKASLDIILAE